MAKSLKSNFISGITWSGAARFSTQGMRFLITAVLARLLSPAEFGIIGLANVFLVIANYINQLGISAAIIQRKDIDEEHLSSAFWANIVVGIVLSLCVFVSAWPVATFFGNDQLRPVMQVLGLVYFLGAFRMVQNALFSKALQFKKTALIEISSLVLSGTTSIAMALTGFGVWSLVFGQLVNIFSGAIMAWFLSSWRPKFLFNPPKFGKLFDFGIKVMAINVLTALGGSLGFIFIGKFLDVFSVGLYTMSLKVVSIASRRVTRIISQVMFPVFSQMQDNQERFNAAYFKVLKTISLSTFPVLAGLACVAPEFVKVLLGEKWLPIINAVRILCLYGMIGSISSTVGSVFCSKGRPDIELKADFFVLSLLFPFMFVGIRWGFMGIVIAKTIHHVFMIIIYFAMLKPLMNYRISSLYNSLLPGLRNSVAMACVVLVYRNLFKTILDNELLLLISAIFVGAGVYLFLLKYFDSEIFLELKNLIGNKLKKTREKVRSAKSERYSLNV